METKQTDSWTDGTKVRLMIRQTDEWTDRQAGGQTDRPRGRGTDDWTGKHPKRRTG